jgi:hypothetical protein
MTNAETAGPTGLGNEGTCSPRPNRSSPALASMVHHGAAPETEREAWSTRPCDRARCRRYGRQGGRRDDRLNCARRNDLLCRLVAAASDTGPGPAHMPAGVAATAVTRVTSEIVAPSATGESLTPPARRVKLAQPCQDGPPQEHPPRSCWPAEPFPARHDTSSTTRTPVRSGTLAEPPRLSPQCPGYDSQQRAHRISGISERPRRFLLG